MMPSLSIISGWVKNLLFAVLVIVTPLRDIAMAILALTIADMITGILASKKLGQEIQSARLRETVNKLLLYLSATLVAYIATVWLVDSLIPVQKMVTTLIGIVEVKSILENLDIIHGGSFFKSLLKRLEKKENEEE